MMGSPDLDQFCADRTMRSWLEKTRRDHMAGQATIHQYLSVTNTPFPWAKVHVEPGTKDEVWTPPAADVM